MTITTTIKENTITISKGNIKMGDIKSISLPPYSNLCRKLYMCKEMLCNENVQKI